VRFTDATWAKRHFSALLADAQSGPITIRRHARDVAVVISPQDYVRLGLAVADFQAFCDRVGRSATERGLTELKLRALLS
jgi:antitoxin Phd